MARKFNRVRLIVLQAGNQVYFDKYYDQVLMAFDKFHYFSKLASVNYPSDPSFVFDRQKTFNEIGAYFPENEGNDRNQSGFIQVSLYFEVG